MNMNSLRPLDVISTHLRRAYPYSGLSPHRDENLKSVTKPNFTCWKLVKTPWSELLFRNSLLYVQFAVNIECAALLEHSILLLTVVISCVLLRVGPFLGVVAAPHQNVGTTLLWTIVVSVVWCTVAEKVSLRAHHCGQERVSGCT